MNYWYAPEIYSLGRTLSIRICKIWTPVYIGLYSLLYAGVNITGPGRQQSDHGPKSALHRESARGTFRVRRFSRPSRDLLPHPLQGRSVHVRPASRAGIRAEAKMDQLFQAPLCE